jgi:hypothetical protein
MTSSTNMVELLILISRTPTAPLPLHSSLLMIQEMLMMQFVEETDICLMEIASE